MTDDRWERIWEVFDAARECPAEERHDLLERECGDDLYMRREVEELLAASDETGDFLESSSHLAEILDEAHPGEPRIGDRIGSYVLVSVLGEGGMGIVYEAEQQEPLRRRVALKLIRLGMGSREVLARFESERQVLALMEHSNIARVLDAGVLDESGRSYFVMELVDGVPIDEYCDARGLSIRQRLRLFAPVCRAIQHAHQRGVIHRDLKPSNILVARQDDAPVPKVIDFGIAKAAGGHSTGATFATRIGRIVGTPEYMSPEQAAMQSDIDTRTDVYALGVVLYKLLVGCLPYRLEGKTYSEIQRIVAEDEPEAPSTRLRTLDTEMPDVARRRGTDPASLRRDLAGDLDWVVMKALDKERDRRYGSAEDLAADIQRHLDGLPVVAAPPALGYRAKKFVRRHRVGVSVAALTTVLVAAMAVQAAVQSVRVARERDKAEQVASFLIDIFEISDPSTGSGATITAREVLDRGVADIELGLREQPEVQGLLLDTAGRIYSNLGLYEESIALLQRGLQLRRETLGEETSEVAESLHHLATAYERDRQLEQARSLAEEALELRRRAYGDNHMKVAESLQLLGIIAQWQEQLDEAQQFFEQALQIREGRPGSDNYVASTLLHLGTLEWRRGNYDDAERHLRRALQLHRGTAAANGPEVAATLDSLGVVLLRTGDYDAAEEHLHEALALRRQIFGDRHPDVVQSLGHLGALLIDRGQPQAAEPMLSEALETGRSLFGDAHPRLLTPLNNLAMVMHQEGRYASAEELYEEALAINQSLFGEHTSQVAGLLNNLGLLAHDGGDYDRAERLYRQSMALHSEIFGDRHFSVGFQLNNLARLAHDRGELEAAEELYRQALTLRREVLPEGHPQTAASLSGLGGLLLASSETQAAEMLLTEALAIRRDKLAPGDWHTAETMSLLGACLSAQGRFDEAEPLLVEGLATLEQQRGADDTRTLQARQRLLDHRAARGRD